MNTDGDDTGVETSDRCDTFLFFLHFFCIFSPVLPKTFTLERLICCIMNLNVSAALTMGFSGFMKYAQVAKGIFKNGTSIYIIRLSNTKKR